MPKGDRLNIKQELFCRFFVTTEFCNATNAYARAYRAQGKLATEKGYAAVKASASENLKKPNIRKRINAWMTVVYGTEENVQREHAKLILQDDNWQVKLQAINLYNEIHDRHKT